MMQKLLILSLTLAIAACTSNSSEGPIEICDDGADCWNAAYTTLLSQPDFLAFEGLEVEECRLNVDFEPTAAPAQPIRGDPVFLVRGVRDGQSSFEVSEHVLAVSASLNESLDFQSGIVAFMKYQDRESPPTTTTIECETTSYSTADNLSVLTVMREKPADGMIRVNGAQEYVIPWQELVDEAINNARGERSLLRMNDSYWYSGLGNEAPERDDEGE